MLSITQEFVDAIYAHARADHPDEACGVIVGPASTGIPTRHIPMRNAAMSPTFYEFDAMEMLKLYRDLDDYDEVLVVIYHSHTSTQAHPSRTDIAYASEPDAHYVLVSTREELAGANEFRSFRIVDGVATEEPVQIR